MSTATIGSYDKGAWTAYHAVFQDGRRWAEMGKVDFLAPMIYWERTHPTQPFMKRSLEWRNNAYDRYTFPGLGSYRYNTDKKPHTWDETVGQIYDLREKGFNGLVFFDAGSLENHWEDLGWIEFASPANIPPMSWLDIPKPVTPYNIVIENIDENKVKVQWNSVSEPGYETRFNIFVSSNTLPDSLSSRQLRAVTLPGQNSIELELKREDMYLSVSALNKAWVESPLSEPVKIRE